MDRYEIPDALSKALDILMQVDNTMHTEGISKRCINKLSTVQAKLYNIIMDMEDEL